MAAYTIDYCDPSVPGKTSFPVPAFRTEGPAHPLSLTLNNPGGGTGSLTANTSLLLVGKGVSNYGETVQENMVHMLENFASNGVPPVYQTIGQLWYDYSANTLKVYTGAWEGLLKITGGTMTGSLYLAADPTAPLEAATMQYVDTTAATLLTQINDRLPLTGGTMLGNIDMGGYSIQNVMDPSSPLDAVNKNHADTTYLSLTGGTMTGSLYLAADPTAPLEAATMQYVDSVSLPIAGGTMTGSLYLAADPTAPLEAATMQYVDTTTAAAISTAAASYVPLAGGVTMTGSFNLFDDPTSPMHPATKQYVDAVVSGGGSDGVVQSGSLDANTGILTLTRTIGADVIISDIASFNHIHDSSAIEHTIINVGTLLDITYGTGNTILLKQAIDTLDGGKADADTPDFTGQVSIFDDLILKPGAVFTSEAGASVFLDHDPVIPLEAATKQYVDDKTTIQRSLVTSTGQTIFTTPQYEMGSNKLWVFVQGVKAYEGASESYTETTTTSITFTYTVPAGVKVEFLVFGA